MNKDIIPLLTIDNFRRVAEKYGFRIFEGAKNLNIWCIRNSDETTAGKFNDIEVIFTVRPTAINLFSITTDPSDIALFNLKNPQGVAIVKAPQQVKGLWKLGLHQGKKDHPALVQVQPITVVRDFNKDNILDFKDVPYASVEKYIDREGHKVCDFFDYSGKLVHREETGMFGINNHRASMWQKLINIGAWSEGCQVHDSYDRYMKEFIPTLRDAATVWGDTFTGTFIESKELLTN